MNPIQKSENVTKILMIVGAVFFFGGAVFLVLLRWYTLRHSRRLEAESETASRDRPFLRRLFDGIFLDHHLRGSGDGSRSRGDQKSTTKKNVSVLDDLPIFTFKQGSERLDSRANVECSVCLAEFTEGEKGRILPQCNHCFHAECVDLWIFTNATCPLCRTPIRGHMKSEKTTIDPPASRPEPTSSQDDRYDRFVLHSLSDEVGPSQSRSSRNIPSSQSHVDLELGENGRFSQEREAAVRHTQEGHGISAAHGPSITGHSNRLDGIESDRSDIPHVSLP